MANRTKITFHSVEGAFTLPFPYSGILGPGQSAILGDDVATITGYLGGAVPPVLTLTIEPDTTALSPQNTAPVIGPLSSPVIQNGLTASGSASNNFGGSTGAFVTSTGAGTLSGTTNIAANKNLTCSAGTTAVDLSLGTGVTKTTTGLNTVGGDLLMSAAKIVGFGAPQALSGPGAANVTTLATLITSTGSGDAVTLANGTQAGQIKFCMMVVDGGSSVITPATKTSFTTLTLTAVYDWGAMMWDGSAWRPLAFGGTAAFA